MSERRPKGDDVMDLEEARRFLWRTSDLPEEPTPPAPEPLAPAPADAGERAREDERALARLRELAARIDRVWKMSGKTQAAATIALVDKVEFDLRALVGLSGAPELCVRFARLVARHYRRLPSQLRRNVGHALGFLELGGPEVGALLVEVATLGEGSLSFGIERAMRKREAWREARSAVPELGRLVVEGKRWEVRRLAVRYLAGANTPEAVGFLRRALRLPHLGVRCEALRSLEPDKGEVTEDDVRFLVEDAVDHPLEEGFEERQLTLTDDYPKAILRALRFVQPPGLAPHIERILTYDCAHIRRERHGLDDPWALAALAIIDPARARPWIERRLIGESSVYDAVHGALELPEAEAEELLGTFVTGADRAAIEWARRLWAKRYRRELPLPEGERILDGLPPLEGPPSEKLLSRLSVLRSGPDEARSALVEVLLGEPADDHETFALLTFLLGRSSSLYWLKAPSAPKLADGWAALLLDRYGAKGERVLMELAERDADVGYWSGWVGRAVHASSRLAPANVALLRAKLEAPIHARDFSRKRSAIALLLLSSLGPSEGARERLWQLAIEEPKAVEPGRFHTDGDVLRTLASVPADPAFDERLVSEARAAIAGGDLMRARRLLYVAWARKVEAALLLAKELVDAADAHTDEAGRRLVGDAGYALRAAERIDIGWVRACLDDPASWRFDVAECAITKDWPAGAERREVMRLLDAAAGSSARSGRPRALALSALVSWHEIGLSDPRIEEALATAEPAATAMLLGRLRLRHHFHGGAMPEQAMNRARLRVLRDGSATVASEILDDVDEAPGFTDLLAEALSRGEVHPDVVDLARFACGIPSEAELYWQDEPDEDERDD